MHYYYDFGHDVIICNNDGIICNNDVIIKQGVVRGSSGKPDETWGSSGKPDLLLHHVSLLLLGSLCY